MHACHSYAWCGTCSGEAEMGQVQCHLSASFVRGRPLSRGFSAWGWTWLDHYQAGESEKSWWDTGAIHQTDALKRQEVKPSLGQACSAHGANIKTSSAQKPSNGLEQHKSLGRAEAFKLQATSADSSSCSHGLQGTDFAQSSQGPERVLWHVFATLLMVGFFGMLRPGEIFNLRPGDINLANSLSLGSGFAVLRIARPKNARQMGVQQ